MALINLIETKQFLDLLDTTSFDNLLTDLIESVEAQIKRFCNREFLKSTFSEKFDILYPNEDTLLLKEFPVHSVIALTDSGILIDPARYKIYPNDGILRLDNGNFSRGRQVVEITYVAGYTPGQIPADLQLACYKTVAFEFDNRRTSGLISEKIGDYSYKKADVKLNFGFPPEVLEILQNFRGHFP